MSSPARPTPSRNAAPVRDDGNDIDHAANAIDALRREWRAGFNGRELRQFAVPAVSRLVQLAPSHELEAESRAVLERLHAYDHLTIDRRKLELTQVAEQLKSIQARFAHAASPAAPVGKLNEAVAPGRRAAPTPVKPSIPPAVKQVAPDAPITSLPRVGDAVAKKLAKLGVERVDQLLSLSPRRHIDYSRTVEIGSIVGFSGRQEVTLGGQIVELNEIRTGTPRVTARMADGTGWVRITWFNPWIAKQLTVGDRIAISGMPDEGFGGLSFTNPEWERAGAPSLSTGRLVPIYPLTAGLAQKSVRTLTRAALDATKSTIVDFLPASIRDERKLVDLVTAFEHLHYPSGYAAFEDARRRLGFDRLLLLQLGLLQRRTERKHAAGVAFRPATTAVAGFIHGLPFQLTAAQRRVLDELLADLQRPEPMARLLQGDVGSGKTVVAAAAAIVAHANGAQSAIMAPTEILAEQHSHNFRGLFLGLSGDAAPEVALLTGSTRPKVRKEMLAALAGGEIDVIVGTHALLQPDVQFHRLGFVVIDEQHRFGVRQRAELKLKARGREPHILSMTATPIPRTLNIVLNGDMDVSIIDELPPGRLPIDTRRYAAAERSVAYDLVRQQVAAGHQVFVICPLVDESEVSEMKAATAEAERLRRDVFPRLRIATLHGKMSGREKDRIMTAFRDREFDILVATSVIEVGIDVPNATVMLVEGADRFGLAQLHQFRGRVGRGGSRSYCLLLADETSPDGEARLQLLTETNDGFVLADKDLELRGPGDFIGTRQSGLPEMGWVVHGLDTRLLEEARQAAAQLIATDPELAAGEFALLRDEVAAFWATAPAGASMA